MSELRTDEGAGFAHIPEWIFGLGLSDKAFRLYAVLALHRDFNDDKCNPGRKRLAGMCKCSVDTIDRAKSELVERQAVSVIADYDQRGDRTSNVYVVHRVPPAARVRPGVAAEASNDRTDAATGGRTDAAQTRTILNKSSSTAVEAQTSFMSEGEPVIHSKPRISKVGTQKVTPVELALADAVLAEFNRVNGTDFRSDDHVKSIIGRIRERPEMSLDDHRALIEKVHEKPWYDGAPTPAVIYGNGRVFDRVLAQPQGGAKPTSAYAEDIDWGAYDRAGRAE